MDLISSSKTEVSSSLVTEDSPPEITLFRGSTSPPPGDYNNSLVLIIIMNYRSYLSDFDNSVP